MRPDPARCTTPELLGQRNLYFACAHAEFLRALFYTLARLKEVLCVSEEWIPTKVDVETVDSNGRKIVLKDVPAEFNKKRNVTRVDIDEVIKRSL